MSFTPIRMTITDITRANPAVLTASGTTYLTTGQVVRLNIPPAYGMQEANNKLLSVTVLSDTTFSLQIKQSPPAIDFDTRTFSAFVNAGTGTPAAYVTVGSGPTLLLGTAPSITNQVCYSSVEDALRNTSTVEIPF
jgi:hypothetical protein